MAFIVVVALAITFFYAMCGKNKDGERLTLMVLCASFGAWLGLMAILSVGDGWKYASIGCAASKPPHAFL